MSTLTEIIATQENLVAEAAEAIPHTFSHCTYPLGAIRQAVHLCLTCAAPRALCSACSVACHPTHEQLELFPKRNFRCDCPTSALAHPCQLHEMTEGENTENTYGQNFRGAFCRCGRGYDPETEREAMVQCLVCEDWYHESCLNLRERPPSRTPTPEPPEPSTSGPSSPPKPPIKTEADEADDDAASDASSSDLPPPLLRSTQYDTLVCGGCARGIPALHRVAGTHGALVVVREGEEGEWRVLGLETEDEKVDVTGDGVGEKRAASGNVDGDGQREAKRARVEDDAAGSSADVQKKCTAPGAHPLARSVFESSVPSAHGAGDVFLVHGWRERWCRCDSCLPSLTSHPYLLAEEETYEPPADPDSALSLEALGMRALERLPREKALDGIRAFNDMRDELLAYLRPFAAEGRVVDEAAVHAFFEARREAAAQRASS